MRSARDVVAAAIRRVDVDLAELLHGTAMMDPPHPYRVYLSHSHRTYLNQREAASPFTQVLDDDQMEDACTFFAQKHHYVYGRKIHGTKGDGFRLSAVYFRLMWLCAIEGVVGAIHLAATSESAYLKADAFQTAKSYAAAYDDKLREWDRTPWPIAERIRHNSDAISLWVALGEEQPEDSPERIAALVATDDIRHTLMCLANDGKYAV